MISLLTIVFAFSFGSQQSAIAATVSGTVIDTDEAAVAGVRVMLMGNWQRGNWGERPFRGTAESGEEGEFVFEDVPDGSYRIMAFAREVGWAHDQLEVEGDVDGVVIQLSGRQCGGEAEGEGTVVVSVIDADGDPVADASVGLRMAGRCRRGIRGSSDEDGSVTLDEVPAGNYPIYAVARGAGYAHDRIEVVADEENQVEQQLEGIRRWRFGGE